MGGSGSTWVKMKRAGRGMVLVHGLRVIDQVVDPYGPTILKSMQV